MGVKIDDYKVAITVLNELLERLAYIITASEAIGEEVLSLHLVKSRLLQKEQKNCIKDSNYFSEEALYNLSVAARATRPIRKYIYCGR